MSELDQARAKARNAYRIIAVITAMWGFAELQWNNNQTAFFAFVLCSIQSVIIRHTLSPNGVEDLLRVFAGKPQSKP